MLKHISLLMLALMLATTQSVSAVEMHDLDQASVPANSRASKDRAAALRAALAAVIVKNAGDAAVLQNPLIAAQVKKPDSFLVQYGYEEKDGQLMLKGQFDERRVVQLLRQAQVPVWGKQRPLVLVWLSTLDDQQQRNLLSDASESDVRTQFNQDAQIQGLPLLFPVMDLDDMMQVSEADVRGNFPEAVSVPSARYHSDYFALASIQPLLDGQFSYQIDLYPMQQEDGLWRPLFETSMVVPTQADAVKQMVAGLSQYFVSQYAVADLGNNQTVSVGFAGIDSMAKLKALETYVGQLTVAKSAVIGSIQGNKVTFNFDLYGSSEDLRRQLSLEPRLQKLETGFDYGSDNQSFDNTGFDNSGYNSSDTSLQPTQPQVSQPMEYQWQ